MALSGACPLHGVGPGAVAPATPVPTLDAPGLDTNYGWYRYVDFEPVEVLSICDGNLSQQSKRLISGILIEWHSFELCKYSKLE